MRAFRRSRQKPAVQTLTLERSTTTGLELHAESHLDHGVGEETKRFLLKRFADRDAFFVETFELPNELPELSCGLHGPVMGDEPIPESECHFTKRGERTWLSRLCRREPRMTRVVTVVAGPHDGKSCILYTIYGWPLAPQEPGDPGCKDKDKSEAFWEEHALSA